MARRRRGTKTSVSLFPFLSILACVIGSLTLIIAGLVIGQMGETRDARAEARVAARAAELGALQQQTRDDEADVKRLKRLIAQASAVEKQLADARREAKRLQIMLPHSPDDMRAAVGLLNESKKLHEKIDELAAKLQRLNDEIARLKKQALEKEPADPGDVYVLVPPSGTTIGVRPTFVECRADGLVIHPQKRTIPIGTIETGHAFRDQAQRVKGRRNASICFVIRPDGVKSFDAAQKVAAKVGVRYGYMPVPSDGRIDFGGGPPAR